MGKCIDYLQVYMQGMAIVQSCYNIRNNFGTLMFACANRIMLCDDQRMTLESDDKRLMPQGDDTLSEE